MCFRAFFALCCRHYHKLTAAEKFQLPPESAFSLLQRHSKSNSLTNCKQIHAKLIVSNTISDIFVTNNLLNFYARCGNLCHGHLLFNKISEKNAVTWTSMISAYAHQRSFETALQMFEEMLESQQKPNQFTFSIAVRACTNLGSFELGVQIHGLILIYGFESDEFTGSSLVDMYFKIGGCPHDASKVFFNLNYRDSVTWNVMINGYSQVGDSDEVRRLFSGMQVIDGLSPNDFTFTSLLRCFCCLLEVEQIHGLVLKSGTEADIVVGSALVDSYGKCGSLDSGKKLVDFMEQKDSFVWSSMISSYWRNGRGKEAVLMFRDMSREGQKPDQHALSSVLKACVEIEGIEIGVQLHSQTIKNGYQKDHFVASVLSILYADLNEMGEAEKVFTRISDKDIVSWNAMIMGYAQMEGFTMSCIKLYNELRGTTNLKPDGATLVATLKSCHCKSNLSTGLQLHANIIKLSLSNETTVGNAVIHMYSECKAVEEAFKAFDGLCQKDEVSWSSIIGSYAQSGLELEALRLCKEMLAAGTNLSSFSLPSCITACSVLAALDLGKQFHSFLIKLGFQRDIYVRSSVIDMYAKCGSMEDSIKVFNEQDNSNVVAFNALISGLAQHGKIIEAIETFNMMEKMDIIPSKITFLAILSACSHAGLVEESKLFFELMKRKYNLEPESEHFSCLVDVFGRVGKLEEAYKMMQNNAGSSAWRTLLSASRTYVNMDIGEKSATKIMELETNDHAPYILLSNLYSGVGKWKEAHDLRHKMVQIGVKKDPGSSWLIIRDWIHDFKVGDFSHPETENIFKELNILNQHMKYLDSV